MAVVIERIVEATPLDVAGAITIPNVQITGSDRYLLIATGLNNDDFETVASVVLDPGGANEATLTELGSAVISDDGLVYWHSTLAPPLGTFDVTVTLNTPQIASSTLLSAVAVVLSNVNQTTPTRDIQPGSASDDTATVTLTTQSDDLVLAHSFHENRFDAGHTLTLQGSATSEWVINGNHDTHAGASLVATGTSTTISWVRSLANDWSAVGVAVIPASATVAEVTQTHFRVRTDDSVGLNTDSGWAGALDTNASIGPDLAFRIRFELETDIATDQAYALYYSVNSGVYGPVPTNATPFQAGASVQKESQVIPSAQFTDGTATTNLLTGSAGTFAAGEGSHTATTAGITLANGEHTEIELAILLRKLSDDGHLADGDTVDFQLRTAGGAALTAYTNTPRITVANRPGHIGGTRVETPLRYHVYTNENVLYMLTEYADTHAVPVMMKSTDGGNTWVAVDEANAPLDSDLEASDLHYDATNHTIHISMQGPVSDYTYYWSFHTSGHATTPDTWAVKELLIQSDPGTSQGSSIVGRSDGTVVLFYRETSGSQTVHYQIRSAGGTWGGAQPLDGTSNDVYNAAVVLDAAETTHIFYLETDQTTSGGVLWHNTLTSGNVLGTRTQVNTIALEGLASGHRTPMTIPRIWDDGGTETLSIGYVSQTDRLYYNETAVGSINFNSETLVSDAAIRTSGGGSHSATADLVVDAANSEPHLLWSDASTNNLMHDVRVGGSWGTDVEEWTGNIEVVRALLFTHSPSNGSDKVIGVIWEDGAGGGTGYQEYNEITLAAGTTYRYDTQYRKTGDAGWMYVEDIGSEPWTLSNLDPGTEYEAQFRTHDLSTGLSSLWSDSVVATTEGTSEDHSGSSTVTVDITTEGSGVAALTATGSSTANVEITAEGQGTAFINASGSSTVVIDVTSEGQGFSSQSEDHSGSSTVNIDVTAESSSIFNITDSSTEFVGITTDSASTFNVGDSNTETIDITTEGIGTFNIIDSSTTTIDVTTDSASTFNIVDSSTVTIDVTAEGFGSDSQEQSFAGSSTVTVDVTAESSSTLITLDSSTVTIDITAEGQGTSSQSESHSGSSTVTIDVTDEGVGTFSVTDSSTVTIDVTAESSSTLSITDSSTTTINVTTEGQGTSEQVESHSGSSTVTIDIVPEGQGISEQVETHSGSSTVTLEVIAESSSIINVTGSDTVQINVTATGQGLSSLQLFRNITVEWNAPSIDLPSIGAPTLVVSFSEPSTDKAVAEPVVDASILVGEAVITTFSVAEAIVATSVDAPVSKIEVSEPVGV